MWLVMVNEEYSDGDTDGDDDDDDGDNDERATLNKFLGEPKIITWRHDWSLLNRKSFESF